MRQKQHTRSTEANDDGEHVRESNDRGSNSNSKRSVHSQGADQDAGADADADEDEDEDEEGETAGSSGDAILVPTLIDIDLSIYPGELVIIIGKTGSGKSSLLSAILGYVHVTVWLWNRDLACGCVFIDAFAHAYFLCCVGVRESINIENTHLSVHCMYLQRHSSLQKLSSLIRRF